MAQKFASDMLIGKPIGPPARNAFLPLKKRSRPASMENFQYYPLARNWTKKIVPHLKDKELNKILVRDMNRFTWGRWRQKFTAGMLPEEVESCDWRFSHRGPYPRYWAYVKHAACHWIVNFCLRLAMLAEPNKSWRILSSDAHSTVWDGDKTLFDFNFSALGIPPHKCYELATVGPHTEMPVGKEIKVHYADHWRSEKLACGDC
jgi:hypothetical protein